MSSMIRSIQRNMQRNIELNDIEEHKREFFLKYGEYTGHRESYIKKTKQRMKHITAKRSNDHKDILNKNKRHNVFTKFLRKDV